MPTPPDQRERSRSSTLGSKDYTQLIHNRRPRGHGDRQIDFVVIAAEEGGIRRIGEVLRHCADVDAVHPLTHGDAGAIELGAARLDAAALDERAAEIARWGDALGPTPSRS